MTIVYTHKVATVSKWCGNFGNLLARWQGSIYKLVILDLILYVFCYYILNCFYRFYLLRTGNAEYRKLFEQLVDYCENVSKTIPLQFLLGLYVYQIVKRWWNMFMTIPWPDTLAVLCAVGIHGHDDRGRMMKRSIIRYVNLCLIMVLRQVSTQARLKYPTLEDMVEAGFIVPHEKFILDHLNERLEGPKYYVPIVWAGSIAEIARKEGRIRDDLTHYHLMQELCNFRTMAADLINYDWVCIPLIYTQVVTLATYVYFAACVLGNQIIQSDNKIDIYVPVFHFLEFFLMMGWLKVAETMLNPFGEDDDDFEVNWLIDRNILVGFMIVDDMHSEFPELVKDPFWYHETPSEYVHHTEGVHNHRSEGYVGSREHHTYHTEGVHKHRSDEYVGSREHHTHRRHW